MRGTWAVIALAACKFSPNSTRTPPDDGQQIVVDGTVFMDARPDTPAGQKCFGTTVLDTVCWEVAKLPTGDKSFTGGVGALDTTSSTSCNRDVIQRPDMPCVVAAGTIEINTNLRVIGANGVVFVATEGAITVAASASIDASGTQNQPGAGALATCANAIAPQGKGGGFGGSFASVGGNGGDSSDNNNHAGGIAAPVHAADSIHGGCPGGQGGDDNGSCDMPGLAGKAGGAVVLIAATKIQIDGAVLAYGTAGKGAQKPNCGGGGGASGGLIVLDAPAITGTGEVNAKGGGGGGGTGGNTPGGDGHDGLDAVDRALDGSGNGSDSTSGGDGGHGGPHDPVQRNQAGSDASGEDGLGADPNGGGGGGGGAKGVVITTSNPTGLSGL